MPSILKRPAILALCLCAAVSLANAEPVVTSGVAYRSGDELSEYEQTRCKLDVYAPEDASQAPVLVWFHGGGLTGGSKDGKATVAIARSLTNEGLVVVVPNYRLSPKVEYPAYLEDAAAAVGWAYAHIAEYGGNPNRLFIGGHSAGGYLTFVVGMDPHYLADVGVPTTAIAGLIPVSGQTMTHFTVRAERGLTRYQVTADDAAPVRWVRADLPPMLVLYADHDMVARAAENEFLVAILKGAGHQDVTGILNQDRDHGSVANKIAEDGDPARSALLSFVTTHPAAKPSEGEPDA